MKKEEVKQYRGSVKFFNKSRFFGFIERDNEKDIFFHGSNILEEKELREGDKVSFKVKEGKKGPEAVKVKKIKEIEDQLELPLEEEKEEVEEE